MALALLGACSVAKAANGRIAFSGAVVEATCTVPTQRLAASIALQAVHPRSPQRLACGQTATDPGRPYSQVVLDLDAARVADDRLLTYFARNQQGATGAKLVVHTYE